MREHDFEPIRGLPAVPPEGEVVLWQGSPDWRVLACQAFHIRAVAAYFAAMLLWRGLGGWWAGETAAHALVAALSVTPIAVAGLGTLAFLGWLNSRTTVYTITSRRIVMRFGAALTKAINIPFPIIESASLNSYGGGAGDLAITLKAPNKIALMQLWPHARPWKLRAPQPTFRALPNVAAAAEILTTAMKAQVPIEIAPAAGPERDRPAGGVLAPAQPQAA